MFTSILWLLNFVETVWQSNDQQLYYSLQIAMLPDRKILNHLFIDFQIVVEKFGLISFHRRKTYFNKSPKPSSYVNNITI